MDKLSILTVTKSSDMINQLWPKHDWKKKKCCTILLTELQLKEGTEYGSIIEIWWVLTYYQNFSRSWK